MSSKLPPGFFDNPKASGKPAPSRTSSGGAGRVDSPRPGPAEALPSSILHSAGASRAQQQPQARTVPAQKVPPKGRSQKGVPDGFFDSSPKGAASGSGATAASGKAGMTAKGSTAATAASGKATAAGKVPTASSGKATKTGAVLLKGATQPGKAPAAAAAVPASRGAGAAPAAAAATGSKLPEGFFDDYAKDNKARGIEIKKRDIQVELQEFEKSIQSDLENAQEREDDEAAELADEREERDTLLQRAIKGKLTQFRQQLDSQRKRQKGDGGGGGGGAAGSGTSLKGMANGVPGALREEGGREKEGEAGGRKEEAEEEEKGEEEEEEGKEEEEDEEEESDDDALLGLVGYDWRAKRV